LRGLREATFQVNLLPEAGAEKGSKAFLWLNVFLSVLLVLELIGWGLSYPIKDELRLRQLKKEHGDTVRLNLILGADNIPSIVDWHESQEIFKLCRLLVAVRGSPEHKPRGHGDLSSELPDCELALIDFPGISISGSEIRRRIQEGRSVLYMVPEPANRLIIENGYYTQSGKPEGNKSLDMPGSKYGIPSGVSLDVIKEWLAGRVSAKRYRHTEGVAKVAELIAERAGCNQHLARLAAWLHDSCKEIKPAELTAAAKSLAIPFCAIARAHGNLLHGPVAAKLARSEFGIENDDLLAAIAEHTLGNPGMSLLSKVIFLADCLEESRPPEYTGAIWAALDIEGRCDLDAAILEACNLNLEHLMRTGKVIHPRTVATRNFYLNLVSSRLGSSL